MRKWFVSTSEVILTGTVLTLIALLENTPLASWTRFFFVYRALTVYIPLFLKTGERKRVMDSGVCRCPSLVFDITFNIIL